MLVRRVLALALAPMVLALLPGGQASAAGPEVPPLPDRFDHERQRAADGTGRARADTWTEGVVRRHVRLADVESFSPDPQQQLSAVDVAVDLEAQTLTTTAQFVAPPTDADAILGVVLGAWDGRTCTASFYALTTTVSAQTQGQFADGAVVPLTRSLQGAALTLTSASDARLRETDFECAYATVVPVEGGEVLSRAFAESLEETYRPALEVEPDELMVGARAGRWATLRATVRNSGKGDAGPVRLSAAGSGIQVQPEHVDVGALAGRSTEYVELKVRLTPKKATKGKKGKKGKKNKKARDPRPRALTLTVSAEGAGSASARTQVAVTPKPTVPKKLKGTYWWGWESTTTMDTAGWKNHAVWFVDSRWAHVGWSEGKRPKCSAKVKECQRYTYNKRKGKVRIGRKSAKVTSEGFAFAHPGAGEKIDFHPLTLAAKGARLQTDLIHQNWSGTCMLMCNSWTENLSFGSDGKFVRSRVTIGSWPGLGSAWSILPPDQRGTYRVVSRGIVELSFDDGTRERRVLGIEHDPSGKPNPVAAGLLLDDVNYYH